MSFKTLKVGLFFFLNFPNLFAQSGYPQGYFIMPINPGQQASLSGCFGDIRINHFHAGLDVRTGGAEGKNVHAAADGYVSRIKVQNGGYGNALYITHPNGYTTVYAHLKELNDTLQIYLIQKQYEQKTWEIDLSLDTTAFPVKKGEIVALSGNTGGSAGPHLHFEIRDSEENALDPSLFGFKELKDIAKPEIQMVSLKCMSEDARINGKFGLFNFTPIKLNNGLYAIPSKIYAKGKIGIEILTYDRSGNAPFRQGVSQINLKVNKKEAYHFRIDKLAFHNKLDMNQHVNYEKLITKGQKIHKCYIEEGNTLGLYQSNNTRGSFEITDTKNGVEIMVSDAFANTSILKFDILHDSLYKSIISLKPSEKISSNILDNFLSIEVNDPENRFENIEILDSNSVNVLPLDLNNTKTAVINLKKIWPNKILINKHDIPLPTNQKIELSNPIINIPNLKADFTNALYQDAFINLSLLPNLLHLHDDIIPLKSSAKIAWSFNTTPQNPDKFKIYLNDKKYKFIGGNWNGNTINFNIKELGQYTALYDFDPPVIAPRSIDNQNIRLKISDNLSGIKNIEASLNGEWLLMQYEYKSGMIWAEKKAEWKHFEGDLVIKVTDNCDNQKIYETIISQKNETRN